MMDLYNYIVFADYFCRLYLAYPKRYIQYSHPLVLPKSYQRATPIPTLPDRTLAGRYFHGSDNSYNR